jgi:hypothetical protein
VVPATKFSGFGGGTRLKKIILFSFFSGDGCEILWLQ